MSPQMQNYVASIVFRLVLPLMPLAIAGVYDHDILARALIVTASMYAITQGMATKNLAIFAINFVTGLFMIALYGSVDARRSAFSLVSLMPFVAIFGTMLMHLFERYYRHMVDHEPIFLFKVKKDGNTWI
jgi:hypothetical protein